MHKTGTQQSIFRRVPQLYWFLLALSPILVSVLIHLMMLLYANMVTWSWSDGEDNGTEQKVPTTAVIEPAQKEERLTFQGTDQLDDFDAEENFHDPVPEIEYRPVVPKVDILPSPKETEELEIISVDAATMDSENKWTNPATGGMPLDTGSKMFVGSFSRHVQVLREGGLDVVFVFDATSSMHAYINEVKDKIIHLAATFRNVVPTCRIGLVAYCDYSDDYVTKRSPLTYGITSLQTFLAQIELCNGGDIREAVGQGLKVAIEEMDWKAKSKRFVLVIGDAPPHIEDLPVAIATVRNFRQNGGQLSTLDIRKPKTYSRQYWQRHILPTIKDPVIESYEYLTDKQHVMDAFKTLAEVGGGESARLINEEKVIKHMLLLIFGTRWEMYLDDFLENI